jgi:PIN domain nuclease of toxin-antitoxin system
MKVLLDTHYLIWLLVEPEKLKPAELALLSRGDVEVLVSTVTAWELRIKWQTFDRNGMRKGSIDPRAAIDFARKHGILLAPLTAEQCVATLAEPLAHRDPFDEMLLLHAQQLGARLLTRDRLLVDHPLAWR